MASVRGRVVNVRPRGDGSYAITLVGNSTARSFLWLLSERAPRLGSLLEFHDAELRRYHGTNGSNATITMVEGGRMQQLPDKWQRRFVAPPWLRAASRATWRQLYPHQLEGAGWLAERLASGRGAALCDDPGLGKTLTVLTALLVARALPVIIVCPSSLKLNWKREVSYLRVDLAVHVLQGLQGPIDPAHIIITNYDLLRDREHQLARLGAKCIVFDEGHLLKEPSPEKKHRAAVATRLARHIGRAVIATGTPLPNRPHELWRMLHLVDPTEWPAFADFKKRYCLEPGKDDLLAGRQLVTEHGRVYNLDELQARMAPCMLRRLKAHVLDHLPPKRRRTVTVELEPEDRAQYDAAEKDVVAWLRELGSSARANNAARGQAIVKLQMLRRIAAMGKLRKGVPRFLEAWFETHRGRRLIVFGYHQDVMRGTRHICERMGLRVATIGGQDPDHRRQRAVDRFNGGYADVFLGPIRAAGVGLNLQSAAHMLFLERLWVPAAMCQAEDRCHRIGQTEEVEIIYLDAVRTVDERIAEVLAVKQKLIDEIVDDGERPDAIVLEKQTLDGVLGSYSGA
jgi:SNF2 family DNA or RNA helicase